MSEVVVGAVIGLVASLVTTVVIKWLEWRRENAVRWDKDILTVATEGLIASERAKGRIYAWSRGEHTTEAGRARPEKVADEIDRAYYKTKSLSILFPDTESTIVLLQQELGKLSALTGAYRGAIESIDRQRGDLAADSVELTDLDERAAKLTADYVAESEVLRSEIDDLGARLLDAVQSRLRVDNR